MKTTTAAIAAINTASRELKPWTPAMNNVMAQAIERLKEREGDEDSEDTPASESAQIWEHVKTLRRRVAGFN